MTCVVRPPAFEHSSPPDYAPTSYYPISSQKIRKWKGNHRCKRQSHGLSFRICFCSRTVLMNAFWLTVPRASPLSSGLLCWYPLESISRTRASCLIYNALLLPTQRNVSGCLEYPPLFPCFVIIFQRPCSSRCSPSKCFLHRCFGCTSQTRILPIQVRNCNLQYCSKTHP
jgi:hypothetical protein